LRFCEGSYSTSFGFFPRNRPGAHCDVGGGYPEPESTASELPLQWMLREAKTAGLLVDAGGEDLVLVRAGGGYVAPDPNSPLHESLTRAQSRQM
jgi:hypothetical protein